MDEARQALIKLLGEKRVFSVEQEHWYDGRIISRVMLFRADYDRNRDYSNAKGKDKPVKQFDGETYEAIIEQIKKAEGINE